MSTITLKATRNGLFSGVSLHLPAIPSEIDEFYRQLNEVSTDASATQIEEVDCCAEYLARYIKQFIHVEDRSDLDMLNTLSCTLDEMSEEDRYKFSCAVNPYKINSLQDVLRLSESLHDYLLLRGIRENAEFGRYLVYNQLIIFPEQVRSFLDYSLVEQLFSSKFGGGLGPFEIDSSNRGYAAPKPALELLKSNPIQIMESENLKWTKFLRQQLPQGARIRLRELKYPYDLVKPGTMGTLERINAAGNIQVLWDNGQTLSLVPGEDSFTVLPPELTTLKLYMPLTADLYERNRYGDLAYESTPLDSRDLLDFEDHIIAAMVKNRSPEESERGLMHSYYKQDSVDDKVRSAVFTAEVRDRQIWGVAECRVVGKLTSEELETLKEYIVGQASDGWGEGFEQQEIRSDERGELYIHLWNSDDSWSIQTEQERFDPIVDHRSRMCGTAKAQEEAMVGGSMFSLGSSCTDSTQHEDCGQPEIGGMCIE